MAPDAPVMPTISRFKSVCTRDRVRGLPCEEPHAAACQEVGRAGLEPATLGLKVPCSTSLATGPEERRYPSPMGKGYAEGSAVEERQAAMERGDDLDAQLDLGR